MARRIIAWPGMATAKTRRQMRCRLSGHGAICTKRRQGLALPSAVSVYPVAISAIDRFVLSHPELGPGYCPVNVLLPVSYAYLTVGVTRFLAKTARIYDENERQDQDDGVASRRGARRRGRLAPGSASP